jgi:hypothetical protein
MTAAAAFAAIHILIAAPPNNGTDLRSARRNRRGVAGSRGGQRALPVATNAHRIGHDMARSQGSPEARDTIARRCGKSHVQIRAG